MGEPLETSQAGRDSGFRVRREFERTCPAGHVVFDQGEAGDTLYVIHSGQVELTRSGPEGARLVARLGPGEFFGEMAVLLGQRRSVRATCTAPTRLFELDGDTFQSMCRDRPEIATRLLQRLAARVADLEQRLTALGGDDLLRPLVRVLLRLAEPAEGGATVQGTLRSLADAAGLSLLEAHRTLGHLLERKVVRVLDDRLQVPDLDALAAVLD